MAETQVQARLPMPPIDIRAQHWALVSAILQRLIPGREVWAFGSRARGSAKPYSDLDLAIIGDQPLELELQAALVDEFSQSDLPWKVDLVDWATTSESFRRVIEGSHVVLQSAGPTLTADTGIGRADPAVESRR